MKTINTLSSLEGRLLLQQIFRELRFEKQFSSLATLLLLWRICINVKDIDKYTNREINILHSLGFFGGTGLWLEEVVNRFYFSTINSFVYFGAAILLVLVGLRRFSDVIDDNIVIIGVGFEALMLLFMFFVMLFTPDEDLVAGVSTGTNEEHQEIIGEVGEISRDFAATVIQLEELSESMKGILENQHTAIEKISKIADSTAKAVSPNPELIEIMKETNLALQSFKDTINQLNQTAQSLKKDEIEMTVRKEIEKIIVNRIDYK